MVSSVVPGSPVQLWIDGPVATDATVDVFQVAETVIGRALRSLGHAPGSYLTSLPIDPRGKVPSGAGSLTVDWFPGQALAGALRASRYVGMLERTGASGPLEVFGEVAVTTAKSSPSLELRLNPSGLEAATGLPLPSATGASGKSATTLTVTVKAAVDPEVELRLLTPTSTDLRLDTYLGDVAEAFAVSSDDLRESFYSVNADWLRDPVELDSATGRALMIDAGQSIPKRVELYPKRPGSTLVALGAYDPTRLEPRLLGVSEMLGLSVDEHGLLYRDF